MSKTIKLEDEVYKGLDDLRGKRDTFSQVVKRLVDARAGFIALTDVLEGTLTFEEWRRDHGRREV